MTDLNTVNAPAKKTPSKKIILLSAGYGLFFCIMLFYAYIGQLPVGWLMQFEYADKIGHLILYFIPSYLGHRLCGYRHIKRLHLPFFPALFTLFTVAEELIQGFSPNRTLDAGDMVCSLVGIAVGYWWAQRSASGSASKS